LAKYLGYNSSSQDNADMKDEEQPSPSEKKESKKIDMKKKKANMLAKMKKK